MDLDGGRMRSMRPERIREGINAVDSELSTADKELRAWEARRARARRIVTAGLVGNALGAAMLLITWPLGALLIPAGSAAVLLGRRELVTARSKTAELEAEIYELKSELSKLQSLLRMM